jgi:hypothetical protein
MLSSLLRRIPPIDVLLGLIVLVLLLMFLSPAHAATAASSATAVEFSTALKDLVDAAIAALLVVVGVAIKLGYARFAEHFGLKNDQLVRDAMLRIAWDAASYGKAYADDRVSTVKGVDVGNPTIAAAANFFLQHAGNEIAHFHLSDEDAIRIVKSQLPQTVPASLGATPEKTS